jgi:hypothetical protein
LTPVILISSPNIYLRLRSLVLYPATALRQEISVCIICSTSLTLSVTLKVLTSTTDCSDKFSQRTHFDQIEASTFASIDLRRRFLFYIEFMHIFFNVHGTVYRYKCILYNQRDATYTVFFIITISALHVSGGFSTHHQELVKLHVQPWVLSCFPAVYQR